ncbi:MAG: hypothetical protein ACJAWH_001654 [Maribacter sp.]|jgi:hypothetical protein
MVAIRVTMVTIIIWVRSSSLSTAPQTIILISTERMKSVKMTDKLLESFTMEVHWDGSLME